MTLKNLAIATAAALSFAAVPMASADNTPDPLLTLDPGGCEETELIDLVQQTAGWTWNDGDQQTQFGGDAVYSVEGTTSAFAPFGPLELEIELTRLDPDLGMPTKMVYECFDLIDASPAEESSPAAGCLAKIADLDAAIMEATAEELLEEGLMGELDTINITGRELVGVFVKAMNPGVAKGPGGRQNYEKPNVCDVPEEEEPVEPEV
jgi:hypothetical protein